MMPARKKSGPKKTNAFADQLIETGSPEETIRVAARFATGLKKLPTLVLLKGDLGAGKTHFAQGFIHTFLKNRVPVTSPSYSVVNPYKSGARRVYHVDLYRLKGADDLESVGFWDFFEGKTAVLVEWGDRLPNVWPEGIPVWQINFEIVGETQRELQFSQLAF